MPVPIFRDEVQRLLREERAQLVDVLPAREFADEHIAGALNIPLRDLDAEAAARLDRDRPVVVYWHDAQWDLSPRAAWRLETLGFPPVYDYVGGKADWFAAGLPRSGRRAAIPRAGDAADRDVVACGLGDRVGDVAARVRAAGRRSCLVLTPGRVVLGRLGERALAGDPEATAEAAMTPGPLTIRPDRELESVRRRFRERGLDEVIVTTSDGVLVGVLRLADIAAAGEENGASCDCGA